MRLISSLRRRLGWTVAPLLLPLSVAPIVWLAPALVDSHDAFKRLWLGRETVAAPAVTFTRAQAAAFVPTPTFRGAVPVLAYHGISDGSDSPYTVTPKQFATQMAALKRAGYNTISARQYARFPGGSAKDLPSRPILVTFDDGQLDSYKHADAVLERYGMRATMFTITEPVDRQNAYYVRWPELRKMRDSGRWDIQLHAHAMHRMVTIDAKGTKGAAYANRMFADGRLESMAAYRKRVRADLDEGMKRLRAELGDGITTDLFAFPFSAEGSWQTNDPGIPAFLDRELHGRFKQVFLAGRPKTPPRTAQRTPTRYEVHFDTTVEQLYAWLAKDPRTRAEARAQAARQVERLRASGRPVPPALVKQAGLQPARPKATRAQKRAAAKRRAAVKRRAVAKKRAAQRRRAAARAHRR
jgi:peptidoglycan/xylan/chitin deacetylase (PgdA/CDA1 family)